MTAIGSGCLGTGIDIEAPPVADLALESVSVGAFFACAVNEDGKVYCWGLNSVGQLGDQTLNSKATPVEVQSGTVTFESVTAGAGHSCALTAAGAAYCWGAGGSGELGNNEFSNR
ncbi:MAG: RCC1 repeat-containing protein, partial [Acidobacteria bacterium]|nr:RCC1 repeat-containing protein [Acidobacteriota bacterium]